jgi:hypothetical protein
MDSTAMEMPLAKKVRSWNPFKKMRSRNSRGEPDLDLGSEVSSVHSGIHSYIYSKGTPKTLSFSELEQTSGSSCSRYDHTLDGELAQVKRVLDLKENDTQTTHNITDDTYESKAGTKKVFVRNSLEDQSTHADDDNDDEDKELRKESINDGEQIGRQYSRGTEVLDKMTVIRSRAGQDAKKVVDRRGPRGQIQYSEDETSNIERGRFDTAVKECKSLVKRESDDMKFEESLKSADLEPDLLS